MNKYLNIDNTHSRHLIPPEFVEEVLIFALIPIMVNIIFFFTVILPIRQVLASVNSCSEGELSEDGTCVSVSVSDEVKIPKGANPDGIPIPATAECIDRYSDCVEFARTNECIRNPGWMTVNCPLSCNNCHLRDPNLRCNRSFLNISSDPIFNPGDMASMFQRIEKTFGKKYKIRIVSESPWVVIFDNFLEEDEMNALVETVDGWERSTDTGLANEYGETGRILSNGRTSVNAWCREPCESHPKVKRVYSKIEEVTMVPYSHYESFQVLKYEVGQRYHTHHDSDESDNRLACGPRILTFFLYLSDVEEGGETAFPSLGIAVTPKRGRALLWPSTLDEAPNKIDERTYHEARTVKKGVKFAANAWIHLYDFRTPNLWGCTGAFDEL